MTRLLGLAFFALVVVALWLLPGADPARLATLEMGSLLEERVGPSEQDPTLFEACLESSAATREAGAGPGDPPTVTLRLGGTLMRVPPGAELDILAHGQARDSIVRAIRTRAANEGVELVLEGVDSPLRDAAGFDAAWTPDGLSLTLTSPGDDPVTASRSWTPPGRGSLLPPLVAIFLAILLRRPVLALLSAVAVGAVLARGASLGGAMLPGVLDVGRVYFLGEVRQTDRLFIVLFVVFMLAMVGVMTRSGGIHGMMGGIARLARDARRTQIATWLLGLAIFFDDYANTVLVGSTMRPLTDRFRVAREKLAYLVDSTAAPVAGISIFSTWIAYEVSTFSAQLPDVGLASGDGYAVFIDTLPYRFYCIFTLLLCGFVVLFGRDFGPMLAAERRARRGLVLREGATPMVGAGGTELQPAAGITPRAHRALVPLALFLGLTLYTILENGGAFAMPAARLFTLEGFSEVLGSGSGSWPLVVGSGAGLVGAVALAAGAVSLRDVALAAWSSLKAMWIAIVILFLAWMIGAVCRDLGTARYLTVLLGDTLNPLLLPSLLFLLSALVAFSTGSSWSTMSILLPLVVGLAFGLGQNSDLGGYALMVLSIGAVLEGSIFGDHCSPISDTTVLSSIASASDHIDHVRTQIPYALLTMGIALAFGYVPCAFLGASPWIGLALGTLALLVVVRFVGRRPEEEEPEVAPAAAAPRARAS